MPQQFTDLLQRRAVPERLGRGGVPESSHGHLTESPARLLTETTTCVTPRPAVSGSAWRFDPHEHLAARRSRGSRASRRSTAIASPTSAGSGSRSGPAAPCHAPRSRRRAKSMSLDVNACDLAASHPEPHEHRQDREVPLPGDRRAVATVEQQAVLLLLEGRCAASPPASSPRPTAPPRPADGRAAPGHAEPQQRPQRADQQLRRLPRPPPGLHQHEPEHVRGNSSRNSTTPVEATRDSTNGRTMST